MILTKFPRRKARFITEYIVDCNRTAAVMRAGFTNNPRSARTIAWKLLKDPDVRREIDKQLEARQKRTLITADRVLAEMYEIAMADIGEAFDANGNIKPMKDIPEHIRRAMAGIEIFEEFEGKGDEKKFSGYTKKVRFCDKTKALEILARHLKLLEGDQQPPPPPGPTNISVGVNVTVKIMDIEDRINLVRGPNVLMQSPN